jgi:tetratricopeptide (TPR) repeat protein
LINRFALFLSFGFLISPLIELGATEGHFYDSAGRSERSSDAWMGSAMQGASALERKQFDRAIQLFTTALVNTRKPEDAAEVYELRADAYLEKGEREKARADYDRALRFVPKDSAGDVARALIYKKKGSY